MLMCYAVHCGVQLSTYPTKSWARSIRGQGHSGGNVRNSNPVIRYVKESGAQEERDK